jgi:hypothetical protein
MASMPDSPAPADPRPATALVRGFPQACQALAHGALKLGGRTMLPWDEFTGHGATASAQQIADEIYRAVARSTGGRADLGAVLDLSAAGRLGMVGGPLTEAPAAGLAVLVNLAAVRSGAGRWRHNWAGPATVVRPDGSDIGIDEIVRLALAPATVPMARERLAALGIDVAQATLVQATASPKGGDVVGGLANVKVDGRPNDVVILNNGLVIMPCPKSADGGKQRLLSIVNSRTAEQIASGNWFLAYEDVAAVTVAKNVPVKVEVRLHDGRTVTLQETWTGESLGSDDRETLVAGLRSRLPQAGERSESTWSK